MDLDWPSVARLRQGFYRLYAGAFMSPSEPRLRNLAAGAEYLDHSGVEAFAFALSWQEARDVLVDPPPLTKLRSDYLRLFVVAPRGPICPPVESFYAGSPDAGGGARVTGELERTYRRFGLEVSSDGGLAPDHVSTELEAMAHLCDREATARVNANEPLLTEVLLTQHDFLGRHPARWLPRFADRLARTEPESYYAIVAGAVDAFVRHDLSLVGAVSAPIEGFA